MSFATHPLLWWLCAVQHGVGLPVPWVCGGVRVTQVQSAWRWMSSDADEVMSSEEDMAGAKEVIASQEDTVGMLVLTLCSKRTLFDISQSHDDSRRQFERRDELDPCALTFFPRKVLVPETECPAHPN